MAPVLVPLRPSSEHILIVRAPGARDQHGCHSSLTLCDQEGHLAAPPYPRLIHPNNFINQFFVCGVKCALRHRFTTFLLTSACVG